MNRRRFLRQSVAFLWGSFWGLNGLAHAGPLDPPFLSTTTMPRLSLIIDDIGHSRMLARRFLNLAVPLTFAVLPYLRHSRTLAQEAHADGREVMLHQPMEPCRADCDPGPGALYVGEPRHIITRTMAANIAAVPHVVGVNNHMGSRFTACPREIDDALRCVKQRGLFFIDSVTTSHSQAFHTARKLHMTAASRHVFIDHRRDEASILAQLAKLERLARRRGCAIGIGHPYPETARALTRHIETLRDPVVEWVPVSAACCS